MLRFRFGTPDDLPALRQLVERAYRGDTARQGWTHEADLLHDERTSDAELSAALTSPDMRVVLAERIVDDAEPALVGTLSLTRRDGGVAYLGMFCVDPAQQAGGIGRALLHEAERVAIAAFAARSMEMTVIAPRADLIAWYERRGYVQTGERRPFPYALPVAFDMVVLERRIA